MTIEEVLARVDKIRGCVGDPEIAHGEEDELWEDVLKAISAGAPEPAGLAAAALYTKGDQIPSVVCVSDYIHRKHWESAVINLARRREQIAVRETLMAQMVGTLYAGILANEIDELRLLPVRTRFDLVYFKVGGKYYTEEKDIEWKEDASHWSGFVPLEVLRPKQRLRDMVCVAMETPLGYPMMDNPHAAEAYVVSHITDDENRYGGFPKIDSVWTGKADASERRKEITDVAFNLASVRVYPLNRKPT